MIFLAFDTETDGIHDPRLVELGAVLIEDHPDGPRERACVSLIVRPDGYEIPDAAARVHGISTATALACGVPLVVAVSALTNLWAAASVRVAYNLEFDDRVIDNALRALSRASTLAKPPGLCTKELAAPILDLPPTERMRQFGHGDKPKSPSLRECYQHFFGEDVPGAHSALADARACARVYLEILRLGDGRAA
jgi:DNA polymerase-3 subunit epsilon